MGGRSRAAAEMLGHRGFEEVYSLAGGIMAWDGLTAPGTATQGLGLVSGREDKARLLVIALGLEAGLGAFYAQAQARARDQRARDLCQRLAQVEQRHCDQVYALYLWERPDGPNLEDLLGQAHDLMMEGGEKVEQALERLLPQGFGEQALLETAMGIEAQALDLYLRMSHKLAQDQARQALFDLAQEEKAHLKALGALLEQISQEAGAQAG
ncbi:MAG: sulfurtransferase [Desulfarculus sp.]|nr:sulfurtransferase [Desulfarculus sp.]